MITVSELRSVVTYNAKTGELTWKPRPARMFADRRYMARWNARYAGSPALNAKHGAGYRHGSILGHHMLAHRAAWALACGCWPSDQIDHINGDRSDNRLSNLRVVDAGTNRKNSSRHPKNKSGINGVHQRKSDGRYLANILVDGRTRHLGLFDTLAEAAAARKAAERVLGYHPNHGKRDPEYTYLKSTEGKEAGGGNVARVA